MSPVNREQKHKHSEMSRKIIYSYQIFRPQGGGVSVFYLREKEKDEGTNKKVKISALVASSCFEN